MSDLDLFHFEEGRISFEDYSKENGIRYWYASDFAELLGYAEYNPAMKPVQQALQVCYSIDIDTSEHFQEFRRDVDGKKIKDFKMTRFACYLFAMNADIKKPQVAKAQVYFACLASSFQTYISNCQDIERVNLRAEVTTHEKSLNSTAKSSGIENYAFFQNQGYMGLYNMSLSQIKKIKGIPQRETPFDYMGPEELGANIFRITQTQSKIKRDNIQGQRPLEETARQVGTEVRRAIKNMGGEMPENLPAHENIKLIRSDLKKTQKGFLKKDKIDRSLDEINESG
jgi:DNA-damage-inducible protein D